MLHPHKHWLAVLFILLSSLVSGYYSFFINPPKILTKNDGMAQWEERIQPLRERLPISVREIGYVSDSENLGSMIQEYYMTKYALVPVIVRQGTEYEWIIGNFTQPGFQSILDAQIHQAYAVEKFGFGIYLIHRIDP